MTVAGGKVTVRTVRDLHHSRERVEVLRDRWVHKPREGQHQLSVRLMPVHIQLLREDQQHLAAEGIRIWVGIHHIGLLHHLLHRRAVHSIATDSKGNFFTSETYKGKRLQRIVYRGVRPMTRRDQGVPWPGR